MTGTSDNVIVNIKPIMFDVSRMCRIMGVEVLDSFGNFIFSVIAERGRNQSWSDTEYMKAAIKECHKTIQNIKFCFEINDLYYAFTQALLITKKVNDLNTRTLLIDFMEKECGYVHREEKGYVRYVYNSK